MRLAPTDGHLLSDPTYYKKLIEKLNFLTHTRIHITYNTQYLSKFIQTPRETYLKEAFHVLRYLKGNLNQGILLSKNTDYEITDYYDLD